MEHSPFAFSSAEELLRCAGSMGLNLPFGESADILRKPVTLHGKEIGNRILAQPLEGGDAAFNGAPSPRTVERYCRLAGGGFGCVWMESISVNRQGRSNSRQLWLHEETELGFADMLARVRAAAGDRPVYLVAQLTHSGRYSSPDGSPAPVCAFSNPLIPREHERIITDEEIAALEDDYLRAAKLAIDAGFDAVDIRACHGYLINELFAAYRREGRYGGSFENRTRMLMNIVKNTVSAGCEVAVRLNFFDGLSYPYGWGINSSGDMDLSEPLRLVDMLYAEGVRLLNISNGIGAVTPYVIRPYDTGGPESGEHQLAGVDRMLQCARAAKQRAPEALVVLSGLSWLREYGPLAAAGAIEEGWCDLAGWGRLSIAYPDFAGRIADSRALDRNGCCAACCGCSSLIKSGKMLRCVMRDRLSKFQ